MGAYRLETAVLLAVAAGGTGAIDTAAVTYEEFNSEDGANPFLSLMPETMERFGTAVERLTR